MVDGEEVDDVEEFTYLGAFVDEESGGSEDIMHRLQNARDAFQRLRRVWAARGCLLYTSPSPRDGLLSRMPSSA